MPLLWSHSFQAPFDTHTLIGDVMAPGTLGELLVLHGAGQSDRARFRLLRKYFVEHGIASAAFDCIGHGETGGDLAISSLLSRTRQACRIIETLQLQQPLSIMAASMGAYTAVKLLEHYNIAHLILLVPAMYTSAAYAVPFNRGFTSIIRQPDSWAQSDAWDVLARYTGRLLIVAGEHNTVIPSGVIKRIYDSATRAKARQLYVAPQASHFVITDLRAHNPAALEHVLGLITAMLQHTDWP